MSNQSVTVPIIAAIEATWRRIQSEHPDVPTVVVTLGAGSAKGSLTLGHFAASRWDVAGERTHELFIGREGLSRRGTGVLGTLLHEAAHGAAHTRGIKDTSRQGRYHNERFRRIGEEFGLTLAKDATIGWSTTSVPDDTADLYAADIVALDLALIAYRLPDLASLLGGGASGADDDSSEDDDEDSPSKPRNGVSATCGCDRRIRVSTTTYEAGPILCGLCGSPFTDLNE